MLPSCSLPALTLALANPPPAPRLRRVFAAPPAAVYKPPPPRQPSRRRVVAAYKPPPRQPYRRRPAPAPRPSNVPPPGPGGHEADEEELEAAIFDFMRSSSKPGAFPTRAELLAAGRADLAAAVQSCGGWLSLGWSAGDARPAAAASSPGLGVHPDYPPLAPDAEAVAAAAAAPGRDEEASPSGTPLETEETPEAGSGAGLEGMLTRLQRDRERARPLPRQSKNKAGGRGVNGALINHNGAPSHIMTGGMPPRIPENGNIHSSHSQKGLLDDKKSGSSANNAWRRWSLDKSGFSDFQAAEIHPSEGRSLPKRADLDTALVKDDVPGPSNGVATSDFPSDHVGSERDEIHARLQNLEVDLTDALKTLRSRFDSVLTDMSNGDGTNVLNGLSDDWEFEETKVMHAQEELRSIRAKIAVLEGKMALEIIERNKIIEEKQMRLDEVEKALSELRTVCIVWPNPASEVLLTGSFDGWTSQRRMERSERGIFSLNLRLYPGRYEIKFIVDGVWKNDPLRPTLNNHGHENNLLMVT
ncbi:protein FLOURY ENDOSPERM 6, chloroplastic-like [Lolium rigidum]|uniref:protein FLOURY ENDOSPERM 6, chloroplastic-like n=1 Tax=Lolium rigidum TaxID=89674 RepID=UPI001F5C99A1|nr:protein FLOURY ENDOSPERM 6, chloroplastic-like [Lolium rigidum]